MKIAFIDPTESIVNYGLRVMASYLINNGHKVKLIFLPRKIIDNQIDFPDSIYNDLLKLLEDSDLVGISFVSNYLGQAKFLTKKIKERTNKLVIWGGIHTMAQPDESLEFADMICLGEGEEALLTLLNKMESGDDFTTTPNFWFKKNGNIIKNEVMPLVEDLDKYPLPIHDLKYEYMGDSGRIKRITEDDLIKLTAMTGDYFGRKNNYYHPYIILSSRGCPHHCTFCGNNLWNNLYMGKGKLIRHRSSRHIINELEHIIKQYPFYDFIEFMDDDFLCNKLNIIREFAALYKAKISLPFRCNFSPDSVTEEKISILSDAGMICVEMGLQTASQRINKDIYHRHFDRNKFISAANIINKHKNICSNYDIIFDNPYETYRDVSDTLRFIAKLPMPFRLSTCSLTFFPGSELYLKAKEEKIINNESKEIYNKSNCQLYENKDSYIKFLLFFMRATKKLKIMSYPLFVLLTTVPFMKIFNSPYCQWLFYYFLKMKTKIRMKLYRIQPNHKRY
jgi:anaerobic magnesium-protoporphyrin IX monomethyl ester cyclase